MRLLFDIETDNLYHDVTKIHCIVAKDLDTNEVRKFTAVIDSYPSIQDGLKLLAEADLLVGHNIIDYDLPVIGKLYPKWRTKASIRDTLVMSRLFHTELKRFDYAKRTDRGFPSSLAGSHNLEAWGLRLENYKGMKPDSWEVYTPEMLEYCAQDVEVNVKLWYHLLRNSWPEECVQLEHDVAHIIQMQEKVGIAFDTKKAGELYAKLLKDQQRISDELIDEFKGWFVSEGEFTPKVSNKKLGRTKGCVLTKIKWVEFNPNSRAHLIKVLKEHYGWVPTKFTEKGSPALDEQVLAELQSIVKPADCMLEYLTISKRVSQLATGKQAWLKVVGEDGIIHARVNSNGAITGRMSHFRPNLSQVPAIYSPYGKECRELFTVRNSANVLVGADADGLELRALAHFLYKYDGGSYARSVLYGKKEDKTSPHFLTLNALGDLCKTYDNAKTFFYALIYGGGDWKLGAILSGEAGGRNAGIGKKARARIEKGITGMGKLKKKILETLAIRKRKHKRKFLTGIDGRKIFIRSDHAALNSLLQSLGGVLMKKALVILYNRLCKKGAVHGKDYWFVINSHDEWQIEVANHCDPHEYGNAMVTSMEEAGIYFGLNVPITGEYKIGKTWAETH